MFGRPSGLFIKGDAVYVIDSESGPYNHPNWRDGVRIGPVDQDRVTGFIPPFERDDRVYQGTAGEGGAVAPHGNPYPAARPPPPPPPRAPFTTTPSPRHRNPLL